MDKRPELNLEISVKDFSEFYWLKNELQDFCKSHNITQSGSKIEIYNRIIKFLESGVKPERKTPQKKNSNFDWAHSTLSRQTIITDNYKNSENVRAFFTKEINSSFKFNITFMQWMKTNLGKTLGDAIDAYQIINNKNKKSGKVIAPQFEYNTYVRDFLANNKHLSRKDAIRCWNIKRSKRGHNRYEARDVTAI